MSAMSADPAGSAASAHTDEYACARAWAALTAAHARVTERLSAALAKTCGLTINEFEVLLRLDRVAPPGMRLGDLSQAVPLTQPSVSRMIARLEQQGWLSRTGDPADRRGVRVSITPAGRETLRRAVPVHARTIGEALLDRLTPAEQDLLAEALTRIVED
ncbi:MarR family transcriptional regulator [Micromonospora sp. ATA32]|nr:MarR family transcriptional regulator [Micromonospora sp. ATA32]